MGGLNRKYIGPRVVEPRAGKHFALAKKCHYREDILRSNGEQGEEWKNDKCGMRVEVSSM